MSIVMHNEILYTLAHKISFNIVELCPVEGYSVILIQGLLMITERIVQWLNKTSLAEIGIDVK